MKNTPRTNSEAAKIDWNFEDSVPISFARKLEQELNEMTENFNELLRDRDYWQEAAQGNSSIESKPGQPGLTSWQA
jgi:hypothetical protein